MLGSGHLRCHALPARAQPRAVPEPVVPAGAGEAGPHVPQQRPGVVASQKRPKRDKLGSEERDAQKRTDEARQRGNKEETKRDTEERKQTKGKQIARKPKKDNKRDTEAQPKRRGEPFTLAELRIIHPKPGK